MSSKNVHNFCKVCHSKILRAAPCFANLSKFKITTNTQINRKSRASAFAPAIFCIFFQADGFNYFNPSAARLKTRRFNFSIADVMRFKSDREALSLKSRHSMSQNQELKSSKAGASHLKIGDGRSSFSKAGASSLQIGEEGSSFLNDGATCLKTGWVLSFKSRAPLFQ